MIATVIVVSASLYWLMVETDWLRVNLGDDISSYDRHVLGELCVNTLLADYEALNVVETEYPANPKSMFTRGRQPLYGSDEYRYEQYQKELNLSHFSHRR